MDAFSTLGGRVGWRVEFVDGTAMSEMEGTWDDVPTDKPIQAISIVTGPRWESAFPPLTGGTRFYASNEGLALAGEQGRLAAKIVGCVREDVAFEARLELLGVETPEVTIRTFPAAELAISEGSYRPGAGS